MSGMNFKVVDGDKGPLCVRVSDKRCDGVADSFKGDCDTAGLDVAGIHYGLCISFKLRREWVLVTNIDKDKDKDTRS